MNPFAPPEGPKAEPPPPPRRSLLELFDSLRFQAFLCFAAAAVALLPGRGEVLDLRFGVVVLGAACGVQCLWRDAKRKNSPFASRRRR